MLFEQNLIAQRQHVKERTLLNNCDVLKFIAVVLMVIDHLGLFFFQKYHLMRAIGRSSAPIWLFFVGFFYQHRDGRKLYWAALFDYALQQLLFPGTWRFGILGTIILTRPLLQLAMLWQKQPWAMALIVGICLLGSSVTNHWVEYGSVIMLFSFAGALQCEKNPFAPAILLIATGSYFLRQKLLFGFTVPEFMLSLIIFFPLFTQLKRFKLQQQEDLFPQPIVHVIRFCSRHSLWVYIGHYRLFQLLFIVMSLRTMF